MITLIFAIITAILGLFYNYLINRPDLTSSLFRQYVLFSLLLCGSFVLVRGISYLLIDLLFIRVTGKTPSELLRLVVAILIYGIAIILNMYYVLNANVAALITTSALLTAIVGFALQATLGNLFEGLSIQIHQPFSIGDWLEFEGALGRIESLTWRAIALRRTDNTVMSIPNNLLAQSAIRVFSAHEPFRISVEFPTPIDTPPHCIVNIISEAASEVQGVHAYRRPEVLLHKIAADESALHYELRFYIEIEAEIDRVQARVRERVWYVLARAGIPMPASIEGDIAGFKVPLLRPHQEVLLPDTVTIDLIAANRIFADLPPAIHQTIARNAIRLIFAPGEKIELEGLARYSMFIVLRGLVNRPFTEEEQEEDFRDEVTETYWALAVLDRVRNQLVEYMGPVAGYLVHQAAQKTADPYHLYRMLAADIPNMTERAAFLQLGPTSPALEIAVGHFFGEMNLFTGQQQADISPKAVSETELLEINVQTMRQIFSQNPELVAIIGERLATYQGLDDEGRAKLMADMRAFYQAG